MYAPCLHRISSAACDVAKDTFKYLWSVGIIVDVESTTVSLVCCWLATYVAVHGLTMSACQNQKKDESR